MLARFILLFAVAFIFIPGKAYSQQVDPELARLIDRFDDVDDTLFRCQIPIDNFESYIETHKPTALAYLYLGRAWSKSAIFNGDCGALSEQEILSRLDSAETYYRLATKMNPTIRDGYNGFPVKQLIDRVYGTRAMWAMHEGKLDAAKDALRKLKKQGPYEPNFVSAELILKYTDKDAILLSLSDDETFALWYYQFVEGQRPDVTVVNLNMIALDWYQRMLQEGLKRAVKPLTFEVFGYPDGDYSDEWMQKYEILTADAMDTTTANIFPIHASVRERYAKLSGTDPARQWKTTAFKLGPMGETYFSAIGAVALQSIIENNEWRRPVDVSWSWYSPTLNGLDGSMLLKGPISEIIPAELEVAEYGMSAVDTVSLRTFLLDETSSLMDMLADTQAVTYADPLVFRMYFQYFIAIGLDKAKVVEMLPGMRKISRVDPVYLRSGYQSLITTLASNGFMSDLRKEIEVIREDLALATKGVNALTTQVQGYFSTLYLLERCKELQDLCKSLLKTIPDREERARLLEYYEEVRKNCKSN